MELHDHVSMSHYLMITVWKKEMEARCFYKSIYEMMRALDSGDGYYVNYQSDFVSFVIGLLRQEKIKNLNEFQIPGLGN